MPCLFLLRWCNNELTYIYGRRKGRSTVAHFARKVRGMNIAAAKYGLENRQCHNPEHWPCSLRVRGPHFASKVSYNASPQQTIVLTSANLHREGAVANLQFPNYKRPTLKTVRNQKKNPL